LAILDNPVAAGAAGWESRVVLCSKRRIGRVAGGRLGFALTLKDGGAPSLCPLLPA